MYVYKQFKNPILSPAEIWREEENITHSPVKLFGQHVPVNLLQTSNFVFVLSYPDQRNISHP